MTLHRKRTLTYGEPPVRLPFLPSARVHPQSLACTSSSRTLAETGETPKIAHVLLIEESLTPTLQTWLAQIHVWLPLALALSGISAASQISTGHLCISTYLECRPNSRPQVPAEDGHGVTVTIRADASAAHSSGRRGVAPHAFLSFVVPPQKAGMIPRF